MEKLFLTFDGSWSVNGSKPLTAKGWPVPGEDKGRAAYDIGKIWLFTKTLKDLKLIWTFTTFNNWIAQTIFEILKWIDELNALKSKNMELEH